MTTREIYLRVLLALVLEYAMDDAEAEARAREYERKLSLE